MKKFLIVRLILLILLLCLAAQIAPEVRELEVKPIRSAASCGWWPATAIAGPEHISCSLVLDKNTAGYVFTALGAMTSVVGLLLAASGPFGFLAVSSTWTALSGWFLVGWGIVSTVVAVNLLFNRCPVFGFNFYNALLWPKTGLTFYKCGSV